MLKILLSLLLFSMLVGSFSQDKSSMESDVQHASYLRASTLYEKAEELGLRPDFNEKREKQQEELYKQALSEFMRLLPSLKQSKNDSLAFHLYLKTGLISHYFDSIAPARTNYQNAITLKKTLPSIEDSFLFKPYLFAGIICYNQNDFDSAMFFYKKAEKVQEQYRISLKESQRLYNLLGVMYYETGNYRQAKNYFEKAIVMLSSSDPYYKSLLVNYKINIASLHIKLEEYEEANSIYQSVLPYKMHTNEIVHNIGIINQKLGASKRAVDYFKKAKYSRDKKNIDLFYNLAVAYADLKQPDSVRLYIQKALSENLYWNRNKKNVPHGLILKFIGDELIAEGKYNEAVDKYQEAIIQFDNNFYTKNIYKNPDQFTGAFSYINLFNTLTSKAVVLEELYKVEKDIKKLDASLDAFRSAFSLADYVERTYDSDEARLFLNKIKYLVHGKPIDISLLLYELTKNSDFLEEAYMFDQRNKASILSLNMQENELRNKKGSEVKLFQKETSLRSLITRLSLKAVQTSDSLELQSINALIRDYEIQLGKVQDEIKNNPVYSTNQISERIPPVNKLQKKLDKSTGLISYHLTGKELLTLFITRDQFGFSRTAITNEFFATIDSFKNYLSDNRDEQRYSGVHVSSGLYKTLISPILSKLSGINRLLIIPDDELHYLPFEALQDLKGRYLMEQFSVQYQYSTALLEKDVSKITKGNVLAFAPFVTKGFKDAAGIEMTNLPASKEEVINLKGRVLLDKDANKNNFLLSANHFSIIHLATHASINNQIPERSYIAFYPGSNPADYKLYAQEIYDMRLDSLHLIILSACETGSGQLIKGEGLMSLSRAFAYAGCPNIITSLWKAEDQTTAFITKRLHHYLNKGYSKDKALQEAKRDLLYNDEINPRFKMPNYWAHLIFIGQYEPAESSYSWWLFLVIAIIAIAIIVLVRKRKNEL